MLDVLREFFDGGVEDGFDFGALVELNVLDEVADLVVAMVAGLKLAGFEGLGIFLKEHEFGIDEFETNLREIIQNYLDAAHQLCILSIQSFALSQN